jgi:NMD protein affecting ribosome stability and mRNA decay
MSMKRCPECGKTVIIELVHSRRALCAACMHQWTPEDRIDLTGAGDVAEALHAAATRDGDRTSS